MSNYTKLTDFASKDALPSGNASKIVKGTEIDDEFEAIETAVNSKADTVSPTFTGTPTAPTASAGTDTTQVATTAFVKDAVDTAVDGMNLTSTVLTLDNNWTVTGNGTNLDFAYGGTLVMRLDSSGNLIVEGDVTAFGTL